ncbi:MAG: hypothetical protein AAF602_32510, partial [Myxococcota bacterium]
MLGLLWIACSGPEQPEPLSVDEPDDTGVAAPTTETGSAPDPDGLTPAERAALANALPASPIAAATPSAMGHFQVARQASTHLAGPSGDVDVQVVLFEPDAGIDIGTSPWHVVPRPDYPGGGYTVWGTGLTHTYKLEVSNEAFAFVDAFEVNAIPSSIPWNLLALADGRVMVPDQNGYRGEVEACTATDPSFLFLSDDPDLRTSGIDCDGVFELTAADLRAACDASGVYQRFFSGTSLVPTFTGPFVTTATFSQNDVNQNYLVAFDPDGDGVLACTPLDSDSTNEIAAEPVDATTTALYIATETAVVKATFDDAADQLTTVWTRDVPLRARTGTTPTLVDTSDGERFVVLVDGRCAVSNVLNGLIVCDEDTSPSRLVAVRRDDALGGRDAVLTTDLPAWLTAAENSPAARGDRVVVANYSGYLPNGLQIPPGAPRPEGGPGTYQVSPDAEAVFSTGFTVLVWRDGGFTVDWSEPDRQASGVPLVSEG